MNRQYFYLVAQTTKSTTAPLVLAMGNDTVSLTGFPSSSYPLQLSAQSVGYDAHQLWFFQASSSGLQICSYANPTLAIGFNSNVLYQGVGNTPYAVASTPTTASSFYFDWNLVTPSGCPPGSVVLQTPGESPYVLNVYCNDSQVNQAVTACISAWLGSGGYFAIEYAPALVTIQSNQSSSSDNWVLGFAEGQLQVGSDVTIQTYEEGNLTQLWAFWPDGTIRPSLNFSLAISSASTANNSVVTVEALSSSDFQQWVFTGDSQIACGKSPGSVINISNNAPQVGQTNVVWPSGDIAGQFWNLLPYEPAPSGQYFTIVSGYASASPMVLTADLASTLVARSLPGDAILPILWWQLWRLTLDGNIVSALNGSIGLSVVIEEQSGQKSYTLAVQALQPGVRAQKWAWLPDSTQTITAGVQVQAGVLVNLGTLAPEGGQCLAIQNEKSSSAEVCLQPFTYKDPSASSQQLWYMQAAGPSYGTSTLIRSRCPVEIDGKSVEMELTLTVTGSYSTDLPANDSGPYNLSESVVVGFKQGDGSSIWQMTADGYIVNSINPDLVLSLAVDPGSTLLNPVYDTNVVISLKAPIPYAGQLWTATAEGVIYSRQNGMALTMNGTFDPKTGIPVPVIVQQLSGPPSPSQVWDYGTGKGLQGVLVQPSQSFPYAEDNRPTYDYVDKQLGLKDVTLRVQYMNLAAPLASYQTALAMMTSNGSSDWQAVCDQLNTELTAAIAAQALFQQISNLHVNLGLLQTQTLQELATLLAIPAGPSIQHKKKSWIWDLVEGSVYTALNLAGAFIGDPKAGSQFEGGLKLGGKLIGGAANLLQTAFTGGQANMQAKSAGAAQSAMIQKAENYEMTVGQLQQALLASFQTSGAAIGKMEGAVLSDWGKLRQIYEMICTPLGTSSLYWSGELGPMEANKLLKSYTVQLMQTLMPLQSKSYTLTANYLHGAIPTGQPLQVGLQPDVTTYICLTRDGRQSKLTAGGSSDVLSILWENIGRPYDYFNGLNGWSLPVSYDSQWGSQTNAGVVVNIFNQTPQPMTIYGDMSQIVLGYNGYHYYRPVQAFGSQSFAFMGFYDGLISFYLMPYSYLNNPGSNSSDGNLAQFNFSINDHTNQYGVSDAVNIPGYSVNASIVNCASGVGIWTIIITPDV